MKPNKNIDRLFQEKLKDLEVTPPDIVWKNIEDSLKKKKERRVFPIWLRIGTAAAILLLATIGGVNYFNDSSNGNNIIITDVQDDTNQIIEGNKNSFEIDATENDNAIITSVDNSDDNNSVTETVSSDINSENTDTNITPTVANNNENSDTETTKNEMNASKKPEEFNSNNNSEKATLVAFENQQENSENKNNSESEVQTIAINQNNKSVDSSTINKSSETKITSNDKATTPISLDSKENNNEEENAIAYENVKNLEDTLDDKFIIDLEESEEITNKWFVASVIAPIYYNSFNTKGSPLDLQFENSPKEGSSSVSYGIRVGYQFNKKLILQSGVTLVNVGYTIGDVYINPSPQFASRGLENVTYVNTATILNVNAASVLGQTQIETSTTVLLKGQLSQEYGYIEVPLELKYRLTNGKLGVHLVGGFSTLFLNSNNVLIETSEFSSNLGEASNLNTINFSANFGLDLDYNINKSLFINVAPMIKIHTSTFSENSENFQPYIIGFYTGLNYRF